MLSVYDRLENFLFAQGILAKAGRDRGEEQKQPNNKAYFAGKIRVIEDTALFLSAIKGVLEDGK